MFSNAGHHSVTKIVSCGLAIAFAVAIGSASRSLVAQDLAAQAPVSQTAFADTIVPFMENHCTMCHGESDGEGGVNLASLSSAEAIRSNTELWETVIRLVSERQMPPSDEVQPGDEEIASLVKAVHSELAAIDCAGVSAPGRVTIRRLNRAEYNNTIRDLLGVDFRPADDFPADDVGNGFDNIGDVLSMPTLLLEKYLGAAEQIVDRVWLDIELRERIYSSLPDEPVAKVEAIRVAFRKFADRAFRRPVGDEEFARLFRVMEFAFSQGASEEQILKTGIQAVLVSPHFLFRAESDQGEGAVDGIRPLSDWELATRLSYFLWSSMPDETLFELARSGQLHEPQTLIQQVERMLDDVKSRALVDNFAGQWLQLRELSRLTPDAEKFPQFDDALRQSMRRETELFFETLLKEDRSILEFLNADFSFVNQRLANHYGIEGVEGDEFQRIGLGAGRRGVLTQASILMLTSNPTRTSPVKRGKWVLENILGEPPPPPPAGVVQLEEGAEVLGTLRERMEQHRTNPTCASCHKRMDTIGFGLENFDPIGAWRSEDGKQSIDPSGDLGGGVTFAGPAELMEILLEQKSEAFARCLAKKMLTYALGRGVTSSDRCAVNTIMDDLQKNDYRFQTLVKGIVLSEPFLYRQAKDKE